MDLNFSLIVALKVFFLAFISEYVNATLGMGYGTILTPLLLILGFSPLQLIPAVLFSQFLSGLFSGFWHHRLGNAFFDFRREKNLDSGHPLKKLLKMFGRLGYLPRSRDAKVTYLLVGSGIIGVLIAVAIAISINKTYIEAYIGTMLICLGVFILFTRNHKITFSWNRLTVFGILSAFNKGISGGGYGPLLTGGQMLSGISGPNAIAITTFAESFICLFGFFAYALSQGILDWRLTFFLSLGTMISVPFSALTTKRLGEKRLRPIIGCVILILGVITLGKLFSS